MSLLSLNHVNVASSHRIKEPLIRLLDRILGSDDLVAVMTTAMAASQITFGRKTEVIADMLRDKWYWGLRHSVQDMDEREMDYFDCFPPTNAEIAAGETRSLIARKMVARRRERLTLDSLRDLVTYLGSVREERKAVLAVSDGWLLYKPDSSMTELRQMGRYTEPIPGNEPIGVGPGGKLGVGGNARGRRVAVGEEPRSEIRVDTAIRDDVRVPDVPVGPAVRVHARGRRDGERGQGGSGVGRVDLQACAVNGRPATAGAE